MLIDNNNKVTKQDTKTFSLSQAASPPWLEDQQEVQERVHITSTALPQEINIWVGFVRSMGLCNYVYLNSMTFSPVDFWAYLHLGFSCGGNASCWPFPRLNVHLHNIALMTIVLFYKTVFLPNLVFHFLTWFRQFRLVEETKLKKFKCVNEMKTNNRNCSV